MRNPRVRKTPEKSSLVVRCPLYSRPCERLSRAGVKRWFTTLTLFGSMALGSVGVFLWIRAAGAGVAAPAPSTFAGFNQAILPHHAGALFHLLAALVTVILTSRALGAIFRYLHQPPVIGEVLARHLAGPDVVRPIGSRDRGSGVSPRRYLRARGFRPARCRPLHVHRRYWDRPGLPAVSGASHARDLAREHHRSVLARELPPHSGFTHGFRPRTCRSVCSRCFSGSRYRSPPSPSWLAS